MHTHRQLGHAYCGVGGWQGRKKKNMHDQQRPAIPLHPPYVYGFGLVGKVVGDKVVVERKAHHQPTEQVAGVDVLVQHQKHVNQKAKPHDGSEIRQELVRPA